MGIVQTKKIVRKKSFSLLSLLRKLKTFNKIESKINELKNEKAFKNVDRKLKDLHDKGLIQYWSPSDMNRDMEQFDSYIPEDEMRTMQKLICKMSERILSTEGLGKLERLKKYFFVIPIVCVLPKRIMVIYQEIRLDTLSNLSKVISVWKELKGFRLNMLFDTTWSQILSESEGSKTTIFDQKDSLGRHNNFYRVWSGNVSTLEALDVKKVRDLVGDVQANCHISYVCLLVLKSILKEESLPILHNLKVFSSQRMFIVNTTDSEVTIKQEIGWNSKMDDKYNIEIKNKIVNF